MNFITIQRPPPHYLAGHPTLGGSYIPATAENESFLLDPWLSCCYSNPSHFMLRLFSGYDPPLPRFSPSPLHHCLLYSSPESCSMSITFMFVLFFLFKKTKAWWFLWMPTEILRLTPVSFCCGPSLTSNSLLLFVSSLQQNGPCTSSSKILVLSSHPFPASSLSVILKPAHFVLSR